MNKVFLKRCLVFIFASFFVLASAMAADNPNRASRPATKADLIGVWEMVSVLPVYDKKDPVFFANQRFVFDSNSSMKYIVSEEPFTADWLAKFQKQPAEIDYSIDDKGLLAMTWQAKPHSETVLCAYVLKDVPAEMIAKLPVERRQGLPKKGDLTLSFFNQQNGKIAFQKVLHKIA